MRDYRNGFYYDFVEYKVIYRVLVSIFAFFGPLTLIHAVVMEWDFIMDLKRGVAGRKREGEGGEEGRVDRVYEDSRGVEETRKKSGL